MYTKVGKLHRSFCGFHCCVFMTSPFTSFSILVLLLFCSFLHLEVVLTKGRRLSSQVTNLLGVTPTVEINGYIQNLAGCIASGSSFYGAKATLTVHALPSLTSNQMSGSSILISNGNIHEPSADAIETGWHVNPEAYGDTRTRFFVRWMTGNEQNGGCYDFECAGFVLQDDSPITPGDVMNLVSGVQDTISLTIFKDLNTRNWWLLYEDNAHKAVKVGYWPSQLFSALNANATTIKFGGEVAYPQNDMSPSMGNGDFPIKGKTHQQAAHFTNLQFMDASGTFNDFLAGDLNLVEDLPCFNATLVQSGQALELFYGGSSGCNTGRIN